MLKLDRSNSAIFMDRISDFAEAVDCIIGKEARFARAAFSFTVNDGRFNRNQTEAAFGTSCVVSSRAIAQCTVRIGKVVAHGRNDEAVGNGNGTNLNRLEHSVEFHIDNLLEYE